MLAAAAHLFVFVKAASEAWDCMSAADKAVEEKRYIVQRSNCHGPICASRLFTDDIIEKFSEREDYNMYSSLLFEESTGALLWSKERQKKWRRSKRPQDCWGLSALMMMHVHPNRTTSDLRQTSHADFAAVVLFMPAPSPSTN